MGRPALWTTRLTLENPERWVSVYPRPELKVKCFKENNVLRVVVLHQFPAFLVPSHTASPEFVTGVPDLFTDSEKLTDIIEFVADKTELGFADLIQVEMLGRSGWRKAVFKPLPVENGDVKLFAIKVDTDIGSLTKIVNAP